MDALQQALNEYVQIGGVYDDRMSGEEVISKLWTELWHLSEEVTRRLGDAWLSIDYYRGVLRETYLRSCDTGYWLDIEAVGRDYDLLLDAVSELSPPGVYFGPHPDTPHEWGFYPECWRDEE